MPTGGLSALLSQVCDDAFRNAPVLRNELVNRTKLSTAIASARTRLRSEEHTSELQSLMRISYAVFCLKKKKTLTLTNRTCRLQCNVSMYTGYKSETVQR